LREELAGPLLCSPEVTGFARAPPPVGEGGAAPGWEAPEAARRPREGEKTRAGHHRTFASRGERRCILPIVWAGTQNGSGYGSSVGG
jgi:hypothetical protein